MNVLFFTSFVVVVRVFVVLDFLFDFLFVL